MSQDYLSRIFRKRGPKLAPVKSSFLTPRSNRYFSKVLDNKGVIASTNKSTPPPTQPGSLQDILQRSNSFSLSLQTPTLRKGSTMMSQVLPVATQRRTPKRGVRGEGEIKASQLGYLNSYDILKKLDKEEERKSANRQFARLQSFVSSEEDRLYSEEKSISLADSGVDSVKPYEEYHKQLMEKMPVIYRKRTYQMKHKEQWSTAQPTRS